MTMNSILTRASAYDISRVDVTIATGQPDYEVPDSDAGGFAAFRPQHSSGRALDSRVGMKGQSLVTHG